MEPRQIEELYCAARESTGAERAALLAQTDPEVRRVIESLLAGVPDSVVDATETAMTTGARLGPYLIEGKLGEGGMGEVFRAVDTRLGRVVAIKTAHERFTARFEREAHLLSSLNHPHICTLYDVGPNYLVMELVEGETLAALLKRGPLPKETALMYAAQILAALTEAHAKSVIHRDLKPANMMIAKSGVKVLDFGLAKSDTDVTMTGSRAVMGTPAYMAPEQREAKPADARTDIYAFGWVLYEMLTGGRAGAQRKRIPSHRLEGIVNRCLEEDPGRRWQSAAELERALVNASTNTIPWKAASAAAILILTLAAAGYSYLRRAPALTDKDTLVLADFDNKTGDPVFDDTLRQGLVVELQQSSVLTLISDTRIRQTLAMMGQPKDARLSSEIAQQVCERTGSAAVLEGSIAKLGTQYVLGLRARSCNTGNVLDQEQIQAAKREDVLNSLSQIARTFRTKVGESLATVEHSTPLFEATTASLEALKAYSTGLRMNLSAGNAAGLPFYRRAVEIDPQFAMAYAHLGLSYSGTGQSVLAAESTTKAWQLRDRAIDQEKFFIEFTYYRQVTGNLEKAYQTLEAWLQTNPRENAANPRGLLGGLSTHGTGRFERAIEAAQTQIATNPDGPFGYTNLASSYLFLDRFSEAESILERASERKIEDPYSLVLRYNLTVLKGDKDQMDRVAALAKGKRGTESRMAHAEALAQARSGRLQAARRSSTRAIELALQGGEPEAAASFWSARAVWEAFCGNVAEGRKDAAAALELSKGRDVEYAAGLALGLLGYTSRSQTLAADLEKRFPEDTFVQFTYAPVLRGLAALRSGKPAESVERLQTALHYEVAVNGLNFNHFYLGGLHSAYVRGEALLAARRYGEAVAEFQKILNHRGVVSTDPIGPLAYLQLGRAYALSGDKANAKRAYDDFLELWKDADPDVPILKQAKTESVKP